MARRNGRSVSEEIAKQSGSPRYLGTITGTVSKTNNTTAANFNDTGNALLGKVLLLQPDVDCYILPVSSATGSVTSSNGIKISAGERVEIQMDDPDNGVVAGEFYGWIAALPVSGTLNLKIWELV